MSVGQTIRQCQERMNKSVEYYQRELRGIRTGRATTALIDFVKVDYLVIVIRMVSAERGLARARRAANQR